jgi:hypothetical protein
MISTIATQSTSAVSIPGAAAIKVKLSSKRLGPSKCQVRFMAEQPLLNKNTKGHMLVDASLTLKEVVSIIKERIALMTNHNMQHHADFYTIAQTAKHKSGYIFFEA